MKKSLLLLLAIAFAGTFYFLNRGPTKSSLELIAEAAGTSIEEFRRPFAERVGRKLRIGTIAKRSSTEIKGFIDELFALDEAQLVDREKSPAALGDADATIYFLNKWSDVTDAPGLDGLEEMVASVSVLDDGIYLDFNEFKLVYPSGRERWFLIAFYNLQSLPDVTLKCYAKHFANFLASGVREKPDVVSYCG
jgi:hypothetical protein